MSQQSFTLSGNQPLIGIPYEENGHEVVRYFSEFAHKMACIYQEPLLEGPHLLLHKMVRIH